MNTYFKMPLLKSIAITVLFSPFLLFAQPFTHQDTLRGSITPERAWWDLIYYDLDVSIDPDQKTISGRNTIRYKVIEPNNILQIELQDPLAISKIEQAGKTLSYRQDGYSYFITLQDPQLPGEVNEIRVYYNGNPAVAHRPPWDGGFTWSTSKNKKPFIANSCQGIGASIWWPCKDHMYDEVDSMSIRVTVPDELIAVANGRLKKVVNNDNGTKSFHWFVHNPINNYGVNINVADYVHFKEKFNGAKGILDVNYYVLPENLEKAKKQFQEVPRMLEAFENWFGPYPFYEDGYKLVEVPYLGMEHQSSITYGNGFKNGYLGMDLSETGWGLKFDFIIVHESGHEWFANSITYQDIADMWIHEGFTAYAESLFLEYFYGKEAAADYILGTRSRIGNNRPIIGSYNVNNTGSGDMYYKGSNMLHTLRQVVNDDVKWRELLKGLNIEFYHKTVQSLEVENYISNFLGINLESFFDQYLRDTRIPILEYRIKETSLQFRWANTVSGFKMPVRVYIDESAHFLHPSNRWQNIPLENLPGIVKMDPNFYVASINLLGKGHTN